MHDSCRLSYCECVSLWSRLLRCDTHGQRVKGHLNTRAQLCAGAADCCHARWRCQNETELQNYWQGICVTVTSGAVTWCINQRQFVKQIEAGQVRSIGSALDLRSVSALDRDADYRRSVFLWFSSVSGDRRETVAGEPDRLFPHALRLTVLSSNRSTPYSPSR